MNCTGSVCIPRKLWAAGFSRIDRSAKHPGTESVPRSANLAACRWRILVQSVSTPRVQIRVMFGDCAN